MASPEPVHDPQHMREYDKRRQKRADRLFHWSLDMPPEDDDVDVRVKNGMTWREMAVIAGGLIGGAYVLNMNNRPISAPTQPVQQETKVIKSSERIRILPPVVHPPKAK